MTLRRLATDRNEPSEAASAAALVSEPLTWAAIWALYPDEWGALVAIEGQNETDFEFTTARVAGHGKTRREPLVQARPARAQYGIVGHYDTGASLVRSGRRRRHRRTDRPELLRQFNCLVRSHEGRMLVERAA